MKTRRRTALAVSAPPTAALTVLTLLTLLTVLTVLTVASCGSKPAGSPRKPASATPNTPNVTLSQTGSTLLYPLFSAWGAAYHEQHPNVTITTASSGSGAGIAQIAAGAVTIGGSDAYLSQGDLATHPELANIALAVSAQQVNYNLPGVTAPLKLNGKVLAAMYDGDIRTWNDPRITGLNPGVNLPGTPVVPLHRSDGSGDTFVFTQYLSKQDPGGWGRSPGFGTNVAFPAVATALGEDGNGAMVTGCADNPGCVAYISIGALDQIQQHGLGQARLGNAAGNYLAPDAGSIAAAVTGLVAQTPPNQAISLVDGPAPDGYPIVNYEYAVVNRDQPGRKDETTAQALQEFLRWAVTDGNSPAFLDQFHLQPLPETVVASSLAQIARIGKIG